MQNSSDFLHALQARYPLCEARRRRLLAWLLAAFLGVFCLPAQAADPWTPADKAREAVFVALMAVDLGQTLDIEHHPELYETNPILGEHPSRRRIATYFLTTTALHLLAVDALPARWRAAVQYVSIGIEAGATGNNYRLGLKLAF